MKVVPLALADVLEIEPGVHRDARGTFYESYAARRYAHAGIDAVFVQDNVSVSRRGTLRGLHLQHPHDQAKLVQAVEGEIFDVAVDVRVGSPTFGRWAGSTLSADNRRQLFIPPGFAHGFCVLSEQATVSYKCSDYYEPTCELGVLWSDPAIGIAWPVAEPVVSERDGRASPLSAIDPARLPRLAPGPAGG